MNKLKLIGDVFNRLTVLSEAPTVKQKSYWLCICKCGNIVTILGSGLTTGQTQSCGCLQKERASKSHLKHGNSNKTSEYGTWINMKTRCLNPNSEDWENYGGRGITVCDRWINSFENFLSDMGVKPSPEYSLDRFPDVNGNYSPVNCRWATIIEQARNKRRTVYYETAGLKMILQDWANYFGVHQANLLNSLKAKGIDEVYNFYNVKYNGVFPNGSKVVTKMTRINYNPSKPVIAFRETLPIIVEAKSIRGMCRETSIHHFIIETCLKNQKLYKGWVFEYL